MPDKRANFQRVAKRRVLGLLHELKLVGNLSVKATYEFEPTEIETIFRGLYGALGAAYSRFKLPPLLPEPKPLQPPPDDELVDQIQSMHETIEQQRMVIDTLQARLDARRSTA